MSKYKNLLIIVSLGLLLNIHLSYAEAPDAKSAELLSPQQSVSDQYKDATPEEKNKQLFSFPYVLEWEKIRTDPSADNEDEKLSSEILGLQDLEKIDVSLRWLRTVINDKNETDYIYPLTFALQAKQKKYIDGSDEAKIEALSMANYALLLYTIDAKRCGDALFSDTDSMIWGKRADLDKATSGLSNEAKKKAIDIALDMENKHKNREKPAKICKSGVSYSDNGLNYKSDKEWQEERENIIERFIDEYRSRLVTPADIGRLDKFYTIKPVLKETKEEILEDFSMGNIEFNKNSYKGKLTFPKAGGSYKRTLDMEAEYPQIINSKDEAHKKWNAYIKELILPQKVYFTNDYIPDIYCEGNSVEMKTTLTVSRVIKNLVVLKMEDYSYCKGAGHSYSNEGYISTLIGSDNIALKDKDIFTSKLDWKKEVFPIAMKYLKTTADREELRDTSSTQKTLIERFKKEPDKEYWLSGANLLQEGVRFSFGEVEGRINGDFYAIVPWAEIKPYLSDKILPYM